jgi:hypothetical protein
VDGQYHVRILDSSIRIIEVLFMKILFEIMPV